MLNQLVFKSFQNVIVMHYKYSVYTSLCINQPYDFGSKTYSFHVQKNHTIKEISCLLR